MKELNYRHHRKLLLLGNTGIWFVIGFLLMKLLESVLGQQVITSDLCLTVASLASLLFGFCGGVIWLLNLR